MFKEDKKDLQIDWFHLGDIEPGHPKLGCLINNG
jgi:hypothetical protein